MKLPESPAEPRVTRALRRPPWRCLPSRSSSPWVSVDPELPSDCSAAWRACRLVVLAFLSLLGASLRMQAQATGQNAQAESDSLAAQIARQQRQITELKTLVEQQERQLRSQQRILNELRIGRNSPPSARLPQRRAGMDRRESTELKVKRTHAPPPPSTSASSAAPLKPNPPPEVQAGFGSIQFHGLLQAWYSGGNSDTSTFRIRRTEVKFTGAILPKLKWTVMFDPARALTVNQTQTTLEGAQVLTGASIDQPSRILQDAYLGIDAAHAIGFQAGQFKLPLSLEGQYANSDLLTVEKALFMSSRSRGGDLADVRDIGLMAAGSFTPVLNYQAGVFNGAGEFQNTVDASDRKELAARLVFHIPGHTWLAVGSSGGWSPASSDSASDPRRNRLGGSLVLQPGNLTFISEAMGGVDRTTRRIGGYAHLAYRLGRFEPIARFDYFDPDTADEGSTATVTERDYITGLNYYLLGNHAKFQINYLRKTFTRNLVQPGNLFLVNMQTSW